MVKLFDGLLLSTLRRLVVPPVRTQLIQQSRTCVTHHKLPTLEESAGALRSEGGIAAKKAADSALEADFAAVARELESSASFQASERDQRYLSMLEADLSSLGASQAVSTYNRAASAFNDLLAAPITGTLARLLGVSPCELYE